MSVETNPHNYTNMNSFFSQFVAANFFKKKTRSPRGFLPSPLLRAGESVAPPPLPQKNSGGAHHFRFRFLDLCIRFGKIISKACPVGNLFSFGVCEGFNSGAKKLDTNSDFEDGGVRPAWPAGRAPSPASGGAGLRSARATPSLWREMKRILMLSGEYKWGQEPFFGLPGLFKVEFSFS